MTPALPLLLKPRQSVCVGLASMLFLFFFIPGLLLFFKIGAPRPANESPETSKYVGLIFCLLGVIATVAFIRFLSQKKKIYISENGVVSLQYYGSRLIKRSEVTEVYIRNVGFMNCICLNICPRIPATKMSNLNRLFGSGNINISALDAGMALEDILNLVDQLVSKAHR